MADRLETSCDQQCVVSNRNPLGCLSASGSLRHRNITVPELPHYSLISDHNGTYRSSEAIHRECISEMYDWCRARNYFRLWAYLYVNWHKPGQWKLWARSANTTEIPVLKTTMIVESHWRKLKHYYLHHFSRPRIDLVVWVLTSKVISQGLDRMEAIRKGDHRKATASWRKAFNKQWKQLQNREIEPRSIQKYHANPAMWTCACEAFLLSRFLICKHIIHRYGFYHRPS